MGAESRFLPMRLREKGRGNGGALRENKNIINGIGLASESEWCGMKNPGCRSLPAAIRQECKKAPSRSWRPLLFCAAE